MSRHLDLLTGAQEAIGNAVTDQASALLDRVRGTVNTFTQAALPTAVAALGQLHYSGSSGNFQSATEPITLYAKFFSGYRVQDINESGYPVYTRERLLSCRGGYVLVDMPHIEIDGALLVELQVIEDFLKGGCYIE